MKTTLVRIAALFLATFFTAAAVAADADWYQNYDKALAKAKETGHSVLLDFTGSDWCPYCIQMDKQVFQTDQFKQYAAKNLVLLKVDFPNSHPLPKEVEDQNNKLQEQYGVGGMLPTFILVDKDGKVLTKQVGALEGGPAAFIAMLEKKQP